MGPLDWEFMHRQCLREARRLAPPADAADIAQEALIRAWKSLQTAEAPDHPVAWLRTIVRREAMRHRARNGVAISLDEHGDFADRAASKRLELLDLQVDVRRAVRSLTPQDRKLLALRYVDDLTQPAVALALGIPEGTAKVRLHRARGRLQQVLSQHDGGERR
ncbi:RNA polymerase sigma factor [Baekduia alba]|uniref:RNA polymerase sigma factor n=1 Tax=Baekduia alba TaxID=2997333 RepID=UPI0023403C7E|nr:sigma-70 family RNA polymerase sigma factor [Baekduia alba]